MAKKKETPATAPKMEVLKYTVYLDKIMRCYRSTITELLTSDRYQVIGHTATKKQIQSLINAHKNGK